MGEWGFEYAEWWSGNSLLSTFCTTSATLIIGFPDFAQIIFGHIDIITPS